MCHVNYNRIVRRLAHSHILIIYTWAVRGFSSIVKEEGFSCEQCGARLSMKWGGFMDGMGIFEQKNEERRVGLRGKIFENVE